MVQDRVRAGLDRAGAQGKVWVALLSQRLLVADIC
jgi:hypothetical protein